MYKNKPASIKLPNEYEVGTEVEVQENQINDREFNMNWLKTLSSWKNKKRKLLEHLGVYKQDILNIQEDGFWEDKDGDELYYVHILPESKKEENIIKSAYTESIKATLAAKAADIHPGFKNLNSSQAFAFNFFQPIIDEKIIHELIPSAINATHPEFEKKNEDDTQFDFYFESNNLKYSFEVKYTEEDFGIAPNDEKHVEKWNTLYKVKLMKILDNEITSEEFFEEYQLWRNICFTADNYEVRFVFPRFRNDLAGKVEAAKQKCKDDFKKKIDIIFVDNFVNKMIASDNSRLKDHYSEFKRKYLPEILNKLQ